LTEKKYTLKQKTWHETKKIWVIPFIIALAVVIFGDVSQIKLQLYTLSMSLFVLLALYVVRRWMFPEVSLTKLSKKASQSSIGAAIVFASVIFFVVMILLVTVAKAQMTDENILKKAEPFMPMLVETFEEHWAQAPQKYNEGGKIEQETCGSLSQCWNPKVKFKTSQEEGFGLLMITVTDRFNNFEEAKKYKELKNWLWDDRYNPKYQMIYGVLRDRAQFAKYATMLEGDREIWAATLVAYNAGSGTVLQRRALCLITEECNPKLWFGGLDSVHKSYEDRILYGRPLWKMRNTYPHNIIKIRSEKYRRFL